MNDSCNVEDSRWWFDTYLVLVNVALKLASIFSSIRSCYVKVWWRRFFPGWYKTKVLYFSVQSFQNNAAIPRCVPSLGYFSLKF